MEETSKGWWILHYWVPQMFKGNISVKSLQLFKSYNKFKRLLHFCVKFQIPIFIVKHISDLELVEAYKYLEVIVEDKPDCFPPTPLPSTGRGRVVDIKIL